MPASAFWGPCSASTSRVSIQGIHSGNPFGGFPPDPAPGRRRIAHELHSRGWDSYTVYRSGNSFRKLMQATDSGNSSRRFSPESGPGFWGTGLGSTLQGAHLGNSFRELIQGTHSGYFQLNPLLGFGGLCTGFTPETGIHANCFVEMTPAPDH